MATPTYELIETTTLSSPASSVTFSSITQDYRDLVLVVNGASSGASLRIRFNGDTGTNYNAVSMFGNGSSTSSNSFSDRSDGLIASFAMGTNRSNLIIQIMDYSAVDKHKNYLSRDNDSSQIVGAYAGRWANIAAISSLEFYIDNSENFDSGSTFSLYGIAS